MDNIYMLDTTNNNKLYMWIYTVSGKKVNLCIQFHNFHRQCRILTKFRNSNAILLIYVNQPIMRKISARGLI